MKETKTKVSMALALSVAATVVSYSAILGIFTRLPLVFSSGVLGIISYLASIVTALTPLALAILLWMYRTQNQRKAVQPLCLAAAAAYLVRAVLGLVNMVRFGGFEFMNVMINLFTLLPMAISAYMFLWAAGCIKKWMVQKSPGYFLFFYVGTVLWLIFVLVPMFMGVDMPVKSAILAYFPVAIACCLPAAIINPERARPVTQTSAAVLMVIVLVLLMMPGQMSFGGGSSSRDQTFEEYLWENDRDSYDAYQDLEKGWNSGSWDPENGFFGN